MGCEESPQGLRTANTLTLLAFSGPPDSRLGFVVGDKRGFPVLFCPFFLPLVLREEVGAVRGSEATF